MRKVSDPAVLRMLSALGAISALFVAYFAELVRVFSGVDGVVLALYVAAAILFASTAPRVSDDWARTDRGAWPALRSRSTLLAAAAVAVAVGLNLSADFSVYDSLRLGRSSVSEPVLWLLSLLILVAAAVVARPIPHWSSAAPLHLRLSPRLRRAFVVAVGLLLAGGGLARFVGLGSVPRGINADEGDRAASAMSLLTGTVSRNLFASGWFYISNVYFWLLAATMKILGLGFEQARVLSASTGWLTLVVVVWIAFRYFGTRVALLTAILGSTLAVSLQFARETAESTPTALLWALSVAFFLEARRRGGTWQWVVAGISGGLSVYFYPSGRLWVVLAALVGAYFIAGAGAARRIVVAAGVAAAGLAAALTAGPFVANARAFPGQAFLRAGQTSVFSDDNAARLPYYNPDWNRAELLWAQIKHSFAIFAGTGDGGGFWPTDRAILGWLLTALVLVGLGWFTLSWRSVPRFTVALWFWVGFSGMVATVETPDLQRMATAIPVLPLLAAGTLDATASRVAAWSSGGTRLLRFRAGAAFAVVTLAALALAVQQAHFYFWTYAALDGWPQPTVQGQAVADQGDALVMTVGRDAHQINAGWVRLLAPHTDRGGVEAPGSTLPLTSPPPRDLAFVLYPDQAQYLGYLESIYPGGSLTQYTAPTEGVVVSVYRVRRASVAARTGASLLGPAGVPSRVGGFGAVPGTVELPASLGWSASIHVLQYWNYSFRVGPGPAILRIDGRTVLDVPRGRTSAVTTVSLARGRHLLTLVARVPSAAAAPRLRWRIAAPEPPPSGATAWQQLPTGSLVPETTRHGLFATVRGAGVADQRRVDGTLATCCLAAESGEGTGAVSAEWRGSLHASHTGLYVMRLFTQGVASLRIDGRPVIDVRSGADSMTFGKIRLAAGTHSVEFRYRVTPPSPGGLEWMWIPPGGEQSIVPPSVLEPPAGAGVGPPVPLAELGTQPVEQPLVVVR